MSNRFIFLVVAILSICIHEVAHGYVANFFGDPTAKNSGRLTLNPIAHLDLFGSVLLPLLLIVSGLPPFGFAKPVPVSVQRLRRPRSQSLYVSLAGPLVNIALVGLAILAGRLSGVHQYSATTPTGVLFLLAIYVGSVNISLAAFNLLPIPPLDGSALIERFVPTRRLSRYYEIRARMLPVLFVLLILNGTVFHFGQNYFYDLQTFFIKLAFPL